MNMITVLFLSTWLLVSSYDPASGLAAKTLPPEPDEELRVDEIYDQESRLFLSLYSQGKWKN